MLEMMVAHALLCSKLFSLLLGLLVSIHVHGVPTRRVTLQSLHGGGLPDASQDCC